MTQTYSERYIVETPKGLVKFEHLYPNIDWMWIGNYMQLNKIVDIFGQDYLNDLDIILPGENYKTTMSGTIPDVYFIYKKAKSLKSSPEANELMECCARLIKIAFMDDHDNSGVCVPTSQPNRHHYYSSGSYTKDELIDKTQEYIKALPKIREYKKQHDRIIELLELLNIDLQSNIFTMSDYDTQTQTLMKQKGLDEGLTFTFALADFRLQLMTQFLEVDTPNYFLKYMGTTEELQKKNAIWQIMNHHKKNWFALATIKKDFYSGGEGKKEHINFISGGNRDKPYNLTSDLTHAFEFIDEKEFKMFIDRASELEFKVQDVVVLVMKEQKIEQCYALQPNAKTNPKIIDFMDSVNSIILKESMEREIAFIEAGEPVVNNSAISTSATKLKL